ncbi:outer membrane lipoprotein-sorting protein [Marixanthomonas spongiae]|uniref:Outer membrane lipoprotein-sorting protein n=1 Tax=Marixanthomonas spongiae TaxID=2174845 RepID=A0A2U0I3I2_9FLAO|nr:outer membrane lipoprotein-sorting protein [Marixanthomonas spongiae]PVW15663.1 outer membrane lipoprotein-sorting protein [Marixanthomonas spongiae]
MKTVKTILIALLLIAVTPLTAQTADEIIDNYFENTGGKDAWQELEGIKISGSISAQGMEIPVEVIQTKDGEQLVTINFQGQEIKQMAFDGETLWTTNMMTMQAEKSDAESNENMKKQAKKGFPSPFLNYKDKGYTVELMGKETIEGTETYKLKLTQDPIMVDGKEVPNVSYYYFETENFVPIATENEVQQGPMKGQTMQNSMSDYQEVDGLYFPFDMGISGQSLKVKEITLNPETNEGMFAFPQ